MGKLIAFWSPFEGQAKTTASMAAVAMAMNNLTKDSVVAFHTKTNMTDLEGMFDRRRNPELRQKIYEGCGLNALLLDFKRTALTPEMVNDASLPTALDNFSFLPGMEANEYSVNLAETNDIFYSMAVRDIPVSFDWAFVDLGSGLEKPLTKKILESADVVVVTLSQNAAQWNDFMMSGVVDFVEENKRFYLIGGHYQESSYCLKNFRRMKHVDKTRSGCVPFSVGYMDAISDGMVDTFYLMNERATKNEENAVFMKECILCAEKIRTIAYGKLKGKGDGV